MIHTLNTDEFGPAPREDHTACPGKRPKTSYVFCMNHIIPIHLDPCRFEDSAVDGDSLDGYFKHQTPLRDRYMIVGYGSNASPSQLAHKYRNLESVFPVLRATLTDADVVYANKRAAYGSIPATITGSHGTTVEAWVTILDKKQLNLMDESEDRGESYVLAKIPGELCLENGERFSPITSYISTAGVLCSDGSPMRLKTIRVYGEKLKEYTQTEILSGLSSGRVKISNGAPYFGIDFEEIPLASPIPTISEMKRR